MDYKKYFIMLVAGIMYSFGAIGFGWYLNNIYRGYVNEQINTYNVSIKTEFQNQQREIAKDLTDFRTFISNYKTEVVTVEVPKIIERTVYLNEAADQDGINVLENYKKTSNNKRKEFNDKK